MCIRKESSEASLLENFLPKGEEENGMVENSGQANGTVYSFPLWNAFKEDAREVLYLLRTTWPIMLTTILLHFKSTISSIFLGRLGELALAGGTLATVFMNISGYSVLKGTAMGMDPICSQAYGAQRFTILNQTFQKTVTLLVLSTIPISLLWINSEPILSYLFHQDTSIATVASICILYSLPDLLANAILQPLRVFLRAQNLTQPLNVAAAIALMMHYPINHLLVVTLDMGVKGVPVANALNTMILNLGLLVYLVVSKKALKPWAGAGAACLRGWPPLLKLASSSVITVCLEWWWYEIMQMAGGLLRDPKSKMAAMGIMIQTTATMYIVPSSLGLGVALRVGHELGAGRPDRARQAAAYGMWTGAACGLALLGIVAAGRRWWASVYSESEEVLRLTDVAMLIAGVAEVGNSPQTAACGVLTGTARPWTGWKINLGAFYVVGLPVALWLGFRTSMGFAGLWLGLVAAQATCVVLMVAAVLRTDWDRQAERARELTIQTASPSESAVAAAAAAAAAEEGENNGNQEDDDDEVVEDLEASLLRR